MKRRNITLSLPPKIMDILDSLYESGLFNSRTQAIEVALFDWLLRHKSSIEELSYKTGFSKKEEKQ